MPRSGRGRIEDILDAAQAVARHLEGHDRESFLADRRAVDAVAFNLVIIGEAAAHLPPEVQEMAPDLPWRPMRAMRNVLVHEYFDLDAGVIWATATVSLPEVVTILRGLPTPEDRRT